jgi:hypothetical protein
MSHIADRPNDYPLERSFIGDSQFLGGEASMIQKSELELSFVEAKGPLPTVEVDLDSIPADMYGYGDLVAKALQGYLNSSPSTVATVYDHHTQSVNFREPTSSAFLLVAGSDEILARLLYAFKKVPGIRARYSDSIAVTVIYVFI